MSLRLTKAQRAALHQKYGGRCAYCGVPLGERWHADHFVAVLREMTWVRDKGPVHTGKMHRPENDRLDNFMPSCQPCNLDKATYTLEQWREKLARSIESLVRYSSTYRHALRFGLVAATNTPVTFYFERCGAKEPQ